MQRFSRSISPATMGTAPKKARFGLDSALSGPYFSPRSAGAAAARRCLARRSFGEWIMGYKVAVVGATGNVGREMLGVLAERALPADEVVAIASRRSQGVEVSWGEKTLKAKALDTVDFSDVDICLMSAGSTVSKDW